MTRADYEQKAKQQIAKWDAEIDVLKAKMKVADAEVRAAYEAQIVKMNRARDDAREKLDELKASGQEAWNELRAGFEEARDDLKSAIKKATDKVS